MDKEDKKTNNTGALIAITGIGMVATFGLGYFLGAYNEYRINDNAWFNTFRDAMNEGGTHVYWFKKDRSACRDFVITYVGELHS